MTLGNLLLVVWKNNVFWKYTRRSTSVWFNLLTEDSVCYPTSAFHSGLLYCEGLPAVFRCLCLHINVGVVSSHSYRIGVEVSTFGEQDRQ